MKWPDGISDDAKAATEKFFYSGSYDSMRDALMLAFAYGYTEAHDEIRREAILEKFIASVEQLRQAEN